MIGVCTLDVTVSTTATVSPGLATLAPVATYAVGVVGVAAAEPDVHPDSRPPARHRAPTDMTDPRVRDGRLIRDRS